MAHVRLYDGVSDICPVKHCGWDFTAIHKLEEIHKCEVIMNFAIDHPVASIAFVAIGELVTQGINAYNDRTKVMELALAVPDTKVKQIRAPHKKRKR